MRPGIYFFFLFFTIPISLTAQYHPMRCEVFGQEKGLPDNSAWSLCQDQSGLIWIGTQLGLARYDGHEVKTIPFSHPDAAYQRTFPVNARTIAVGPTGDIWIGCAHGELFRFDQQTLSFIPYFEPVPGQIRVGPNIRKIVVDHRSRVWGIANGQLFYIQASKEDLPWQEAAKTPRKYFPSNFSGEQLSDLQLDGNGNLWTATRSGLAKWQEQSQSFIHYPLPEKLDNHPINRFDTNNDTCFWLAAGEGGLLCFNPQTGQYKNTRYLSDKENHLINNVFQDRSGKLWLFDSKDQPTTILTIAPNTKPVKEWRVETGLPSANTFAPLEIIESEEGVIWMADQSSGLLKYRPDSEVFEQIPFYSFDNRLSNKIAVNDLLVDAEGNIWAATFNNGVFQWDPQTGQSRHFSHLPGNTNSLLSNNIRCLELTSENTIWVGTPTGVNVIHPKTFTISNFKSIPEAPDILKNGSVQYILSVPEKGYWLAASESISYWNPVSGKYFSLDSIPVSSGKEAIIEPDELFLDSRGNLWIGTSGSYFYHYNPTTQQGTAFKFPPGGDFCEDQNQTVWVGDYGSGLIGINIHTLKWEQFTQEDGLPHNKVRSIIPAEDGALWIGTNYGLSHFDPVKKIARNYFVEDGLPDNVFRSQAHFLMEDGRMLFTTYNGILRFHPDSVQVDTVGPRICMLAIQVNGQSLNTLQRKGEIEENVSLQYFQNNLELTFSAVHFQNPTRNQYRVMLENYDEAWKDLDNQNKVNYTNLPPGRYNFRVKAANNDGYWNEEGIALQIIIQPPWYWNTWSQLMYLVLIIGSIIGIYRFQLNRRLAIAEATRLKELDEVKTKLYTNITHEFRTPLTVIQGVSEQIKEHEEEKELIQRNSRQLLQLINQMLDLSKIEAGKLELQLIHGDVLSFLRYVTESFHSLALNQRINLNFYSGLDQLEMDYDPEKVLQILSNLISNAVKFTPEYGKIQVTAQAVINDQQPALRLQIKDTGTGIPPDQLPFIFERFYQTDSKTTRKAEGTGIGLALTKELVELMDGTINAKSQLGEGTTFTVIFPIRKTAPRQKLPEKELQLKRKTAVITNDLLPPIQNSPETDASERPILLIVEDNRDVMRYLTTSLTPDYQLLYARNGREGIEKAFDEIPDIIISDVMMPEVDGFELCQTLKTNERTSHIPIILLTAKADMDSKLEGLDYGADAYLAKPFHQRELHIRLKRLLELRQKLQQKYRHGNFTIQQETQLEDSFIQKVRQVLLDRIDEENFDTEALAEALHMSRVHLYRKLKALTGESTSHFVRKIRLREAHRLLNTTTLNVTEVAYSVGFSDLAYFSKLFSKEFGEAPSKIRGNPF